MKNLSCALNALRRSLAYLVENNIKLGGVLPTPESTNVDAIYNAISGDDDRIKEFFESLCFTEKDNPREFVRVLDDFQDFRHLPNSIGDYAADECVFIRYKIGPESRTRFITANNDGVFLFIAPEASFLNA